MSDSPVQNSSCSSNIAEKLTASDSSESDPLIHDSVPQKAMDLNDVIGVPQSDVCDSTLESEIDALSKIIDTKDISNLKGEFDELKEQSDDINWTANFDYEISEEKQKVNSSLEQNSLKVGDNDTKPEMDKPGTSASSENDEIVHSSDNINDTTVKTLPEVSEVDNLPVQESLSDVKEADNKIRHEESALTPNETLDVNDKSKEENIIESERVESDVKPDVNPVTPSVVQEEHVLIPNEKPEECSDIAEEKLVENENTKTEQQSADITKITSDIDEPAEQVNEPAETTIISEDIDMNNAADKTEETDNVSSELTESEQVSNESEETSIQNNIILEIKPVLDKENENIPEENLDTKISEQTEETNVCNVECPNEEKAEEIATVTEECMDVDQSLDENEEASTLESQNIDEHSVDSVSKSEEKIEECESMDTEPICDTTETIQNEMEDTEQVCNKMEEIATEEIQKMTIEPVCDKEEEMVIVEPENVDTKEVADEIENKSVESENMDVTPVCDKTEQIFNLEENVTTKPVIDEVEEVSAVKSSDTEQSPGEVISTLENVETDTEQIHNKAKDTPIVNEEEEEEEKPSMTVVDSPEKEEEEPSMTVVDSPEKEEEEEESSMTVVDSPEKEEEEEEESSMTVVNSAEKEHRIEDEASCSAADNVEEIAEKETECSANEEESEHISVVQEIEPSQEAIEETSVCIQNETDCDEKNENMLEQSPEFASNETKDESVEETNIDETEALSSKNIDEEYCSTEEAEASANTEETQSSTTNTGVAEAPTDNIPDTDRTTKNIPEAECSEITEEISVELKSSENSVTENEENVEPTELIEKETEEDETIPVINEEVEQETEEETLRTTEDTKMEDIVSDEEPETLNLVDTQVTEDQSEVQEVRESNIPDVALDSVVSEVDMPSSNVNESDNIDIESPLITNVESENEPMDQTEDIVSELPVDKITEVAEIPECEMAEIKDVIQEDSENMNTQEQESVEEHSDVCIQDAVESMNIPSSNITTESMNSIPADSITDKEKIIEESEKSDNEGDPAEVMDVDKSLEEEDVIEESLNTNGDSLQNIAPVEDVEENIQPSDVNESPSKASEILDITEQKATDENEASISKEPVIESFINTNEVDPLSEETVTNNLENENIEHKQPEEFRDENKEIETVTDDQSTTLNSENENEQTSESISVITVENDPLADASVTLEHNASDEESEEQVEINLSLDPDDSNSPCSKDLFEKGSDAEKLEEITDVEEPSSEITENVNTETEEIQYPSQQTNDDLSLENEESETQINKLELNEEAQLIDRDNDMSLVLEESSNSQAASDYSNTADNKEECNINDADENSVEDSTSSKTASNFANLILQEKNEYNFEKSNEELDDTLSVGRSDLTNTDMVSETPEISELESAVKFLQESEEHTTESMAISPKMVNIMIENIVAEEKNRTLFVSTESSTLDDVSEFDTSMEEITSDPIAISEAEIISEAAKLENERKAKLDKEIEESRQSTKPVETFEDMDIDMHPANSNLLQVVKEQSNIVKNDDNTPSIKLDKSETLPKASFLEERLKEPPKIEIPESGKMCDLSNPTKTNLLIPKDAKLSPFAKAIDSPKETEKMESKLLDTPKKEMDKVENENVGSPRIILKIAKSAITDCAEPRSPKSPKIRSATNSPNPEDTAGQKLGKIKLKLSKSGHPSIISNDKVDESSLWHTDSTCSLSPVGVKIKLSKSGEMSSLSEKHDISEEKEKRDQSPLGMKIKLSKSGDASIVQEPAKETSTSKHKDKLEGLQEAPKRTDSPIGMKLKLSKSGDVSIIPVDKVQSVEDSGTSGVDEIQDSKRSEPHIGVKMKLSKSGDGSIVSCDQMEETKDVSKPKEKVSENSSIGMKIKLTKSKSGNTSIVSSDSIDQAKDKQDLTDSPKRTGMKFKLSKTGDASIIHSEVATEEASEVKSKEQEPLKIKVSKVANETVQLSASESIRDDSPKRNEAGIGIKITRWKSGDAAVVPETKKPAESPVGVKIKFSKTGDPSIVHPETLKTKEDENQKLNEPSVKVKHSKTRELSVQNEPEKKDKPMKIKLSKTGHPTIVTTSNTNESLAQSSRHKEIPKKGHSDLVIESVQTRTMELQHEATPKRKDITIAPIEPKKLKLDTKLSQMLPDVTIQPISQTEQQSQLVLEQRGTSISRQQMNVINREISITHVRSLATPETLIGDRLKNILLKSTPASSSPSSSDCEIIEHRPELIIVNENSNSSQDVMIIDEVPPQASTVKIPKKRGRPRRSDKAIQEAQILKTTLIKQALDPLACEQPQVITLTPKENERPRRTCRSQKSYAPPKRGRGGRGRGGKRKLEDAEEVRPKKMKIDQDLTEIERSTTALISVQTTPLKSPKIRKSSELYKALKQSPGRKMKQKPVEIIETPICTIAETISLSESTMEIDSTPTITEIIDTPPVVVETVESPIVKDVIEILPPIESKIEEAATPEKKEPLEVISPPEEKPCEKIANTSVEEPLNWLTPPSKKVSEPSIRSETVSAVTVIDEETRMSAECSSRSQTPARSMTAPVSETIVNEESQGSVLSTATTESEKVKVKNRRMEINFDPDEGPFTVDKLAEYEWPPDKKGDTFMIQEQISQYLGVKSFKRKYPDLKRRMVDMEERNHLRENALVSEGMCDMGLTAVCSSEVLDVMCSDFPDQYEEYRKHMRDKQIKEHSKKQKELTAAATAEKNRIDLAEMAMQSVLSWNANLNKARKDTRKCSLDLQTFTIHMPKKQQKVETDRSVSHYPVALIPGQYTDYYREYTPAELRYYPLNTVLYGPMKPNERKFDSQSEGSQSDSDSDSSSDDSSSSSSEGTQDTEESQSTMDEVDMEIAAQKEENKNIKCKMCLKNLNKNNRPEVLIQCGTCSGSVHPSCIDLTVDMVPHIRGYSWQCTDCKTCAQCHDPADEDKMLFCDMCDRGYHIYCVGLRRVPQGRWHCQECAVCANCGSKEPGGANSDRNSVAQWQHEYKKGDKNTRVYVSTLCVPCSKLRGNQGLDNRQEKLSV